MSASETETSRPELDDDFDFSSTPLQWIIVPIIIVGFVVALLAAGCRLKRRRSRMVAGSSQQWPMPSGDARGAFLGTIRRGSQPQRTEEGLNELGEAPPPYDPKNDNGNGSGPPAYDVPAQPPPALTSDDRRPGDPASSPGRPMSMSQRISQFMNPNRPMSMNRSTSSRTMSMTRMSRPTSTIRSPGMASPEMRSPVVENAQDRAGQKPSGMPASDDTMSSK